LRCILQIYDLTRIVHTFLTLYRSFLGECTSDL
jgi:hypothetical protein